MAGGFARSPAFTFGPRRFMPLTVYVTNHALIRWNERASRYADETPKEITEAVQEARKIADNERLPFTRLAGTHYYLNEERQCYFVCQPIDRTTLRVITVISAEPTPTTTEADQVLVGIEQAHRGLLNELDTLEGKLANTSKGDSLRTRLVRQKTECQQKLTVHKEKLRQARQERDERSNEIFRPDGSVNYLAATLYLIGEMESLTRRMSAIEAKVAHPEPIPAEQHQ